MKKPAAPAAPPAAPEIHILDVARLFAVFPYPLNVYASRAFKAFSLIGTPRRFSVDLGKHIAKVTIATASESHTFNVDMPALQDGMRRFDPEAALAKLRELGVPMPFGKKQPKAKK